MVGGDCCPGFINPATAVLGNYDWKTETGCLVLVQEHGGDLLSFSLWGRGKGTFGSPRVIQNSMLCMGFSGNLVSPLHLQLAHFLPKYPRGLKAIIRPRSSCALVTGPLPGKLRSPALNGPAEMPRCAVLGTSPANSLGHS